MRGASANPCCGTTRKPPVATTGAVVFATVNGRNGAPSSVRSASRRGSTRVREKTSNGPAKSSTSTWSKIRMPTLQGWPCMREV